MNWLYLLLAGIMEIGWLISLKYTEGFTKIIPLIFYAIFGFTNAYLFSLSLKAIPMAIAYTIWMGIAIIGITITEIFIFNKEYDLMKLIFMMLIITGIIGLRITFKPT
ncbi:MAG: QacE family quaternary ammonium compound efflux SMR transporter [Ignavibacteriaceae bacterium]|nr:QacE family quaternary ammonium compound efflux SMR transporter [Ignavibacteriaceae bacterium]